MILLLSPSKTQDFESEIRDFTTTRPVHLKDSALLIDALRTYSRPKLARLMAISDALAHLNYDRYRRFHTPFTPANARPALFAFRGDVYDGLDADGMDDETVAFAQDHLRMLSGLYGVLRPLDLIQPYRLEMKIRLKTPSGPDLYAFWGDRLARTLEKSATGPVVNLASEEYFKAVGPHLTLPVITPQFKEKRGDTYKILGLFAKKARGRMARWLLEQGDKGLKKIKNFSEDGYVYDAKLSDNARFVFTRG